MLFQKLHTFIHTEINTALDKPQALDPFMLISLKKKYRFLLRYPPVTIWNWHWPWLGGQTHKEYCKGGGGAYQYMGTEIINYGSRAATMTALPKITYNNYILDTCGFRQSASTRPFMLISLKKKYGFLLLYP